MIELNEVILKDKIENFISEYTDLRNKKETNVIYLTSRCNFYCEYCFENENRKTLKKPINITEKEIDLYLDDIEWRESGLNSTIVFFGGEPLLMLDKIEYTINSMHNRKKMGSWGWEITTNGYLLKDKDIFGRVKELLEFNDKSIIGSLKISFDGSGQFKRKILKNNKDSYIDIIEVLKKVDSLNIQFKISYTISDGNLDSYKKDLIWIIKKFKNVKEIIINVARSHIEERIWKKHDDYDKFMKEIEIFCSALFHRYGIPFCELICDECKRCKKDESRNNYLIPEKEKTKEEKETYKKFNKF